MATLSEHAKAIKAAIKAAQDDGFKVEADVQTVLYDGTVELVEIDVWNGSDYINVFTEDRT